MAIQLMKQRPNECLLASLSMVCNRNYDLLSASFSAKYGVDWGQCSPKQAHEWWKAFALDMLGVDLPLWAINSQFKPVTNTLKDAFKPANKGILLLLGTLACHAVAFEGQTIYDPSKGQYDMVEYFRLFAWMPYGALVLREGV